MSEETTTQESQKTEYAEIVTIESSIQNALVKANITDKIIGELKEKYGSLQIAGIDDKDGYRTVREGRMVCKNLRVEAKKICVKGREDALKTQKAWVAKEKEVTDKISEVEEYLQEQEDNYIAERDRITREKEEKLEEQRTRRTMQLTQLGAEFKDGSFILDDASVELTMLRDVDESIYESDILPKFQAIHEQKAKEERDRLEKEKAEKEQAEKQRKELESLKELRTTSRGKELLAAGYVWKSDKGVFEYKDIDAISINLVSDCKNEDWPTIIEGAKTMVEEDLARLKLLAEKQERYDKRCDQLAEMAFVFVKKENRFKCYHVLIDDNSVREIDNEHWENFMSMATEEITKAKKEAEEQRNREEKERAERDRKQAVGGMRAMMLAKFKIDVAADIAAEWTEEEFQQKYNDAEVEHERKRKEKEEQERKEKEENMKDKDKFTNFLRQLNLIPVPEFRSGQYRKRGQQLNDLLNQINSL